MSSAAIAPSAPARARVSALAASGALRPLRPLAGAWALSHREHFAHAGGVILEAVESLLTEALERAPAPLREVTRLERARGRGLGFTRLDVVLPEEAPEAFSLLEVQAGDPSAMGWTDALSEALGGVGTLMPSHRRRFEALTPGRRIAFVVPEGSIVESDHRLLAGHYAAHGWQALCVDPSALAFEHGTLTAAGAEVDAVFRDAWDELFLPRAGAGGAALVAAVKADAVALLNPFVATLADDKAWLEALSTPSRWPTETARVLASHVPCTRLVRERRVDWEGREVDFPRHLERHQEWLVLKPIDGYGGADVTVGPQVSAQAWSAAIERALVAPDTFVAQRHCPLPRQPVYVLDEPEPRLANVVHSLWFHPELAGAFVRASDEPVVNVHRGGGLGPVCFQM